MMPDDKPAKKQMKLGGYLIALGIGAFIGLWLCSACSYDDSEVSCAMPWKALNQLREVHTDV